MKVVYILSWLFLILYRHLLHLTLISIATLSVYSICQSLYRSPISTTDLQTPSSNHHGNKSPTDHVIRSRNEIPAVRTQRAVKVLVAGYYRSGSTLTGELFAAHNHTMYLYEFSRPTIIQWYEAQSRLDTDLHLDAGMSTGGKKALYETAIVEPLLSVFTCNITSIPTQMLVNFFWRRKCLGWPTRRFLQCADTIPRCAMKLHWPCTLSVTHHSDPALLHLCYSAMYDPLDKVKVVPWNQTSWNDVIKPSIMRYRECDERRGRVVRRCAAQLSEDCAKAPVRAVKEVRLDLRLLQPLLTRDLDLRIVHLVRDPRGIMASTSSLVTVSHICGRMLRDLDAFQVALTSHPDCCVLVRYEDLTVDPHAVARRVFKHVGLDFESYFDAWIHRVSDPRHNSGSGGTYRTNMSAEAFDWKIKLPISTQVKVRQIDECEQVIKRLGYDTL